MDKIQAANQLNSFLGPVVKHAGFKLKYRITVDPRIEDNREWERPEILVEFAGPDAQLLLEIPSAAIYKTSIHLSHIFQQLSLKILHPYREN